MLNSRNLDCRKMVKGHLVRCHRTLSLREAQRDDVFAASAAHTNTSFLQIKIFTEKSEHMQMDFPDMAFVGERLTAHLVEQSC